MSGINGFEHSLATFNPQVDDWNQFKKEQGIKGQNFARALEIFAENFTRLPGMGQKERAEFFAARLPAIIDGVNERVNGLRDPDAPKTIFERVFASADPDKKENQIASLKSSLEKIQEGLDSLRPEAWSRDRMPSGAVYTMETPIASGEQGQIERDFTGRGNYFLQNTETGKWEKLENNATTIRLFLEGRGASRADIDRAMLVASQDTLNSLSISLSTQASPSFLTIDPKQSASYFAVIDGKVCVHTEAKAQLRTDLTKANAPTEEVRLMAVFNPAETAKSTCITMYKD